MALGIVKIYLESPFSANRRCTRSVCSRSVDLRSVCRGQLSWTQDCLPHATAPAYSSLMQSLLVLGAEKNEESNDVKQEAAVLQQTQNYLKEKNAKSTDPFQWWHSKKEI